LKPYTYFNIKTKTYHLLAITALLSAVISFLFTNGSLDINLHDTYFVISYAVVYQLIAIILIMVWTIYALAINVLPSLWLSWAHVLITTTIVALLLCKQIHFIGLDGAPRRYYAFSEVQKKQQDTFLTSIIITAAFLMGQLLFIINLVMGIAKKINS
jgi:cytochrome c oxidase subunit 1